MNIKEPVRTHKRTIRWNLAVHYTQVIYMIISGIVLVPLYLKYIPRETYGYWLAVGNIVAWLSMIDPGFSKVVQQRTALYYGARNLIKVGQYALGGILVNLVFVLVLAIAGWVISTKFTTWLEISDPAMAQLLMRAYNIALIGTLIMLVSFILTAINQGLQSSLGIGIVYVFANFSGIIVTIILLWKGWSAVAIAAALFWRALIYLVGNLAYLLWRIIKEKIKLSYDISVVKEFTGLSVYNFMGKLGSTLSYQLNSFVSAKMLSPLATNVLKFTQTVPETSKLLLVRPSMALTPSLTHLIGEGQHEKVRDVLMRFMNFLIWGSSIAAVGFVIFNRPFITLWIGESFYGGTLLNILVVTYLYITIFTQSFSHIVFAIGNIKTSNLVLFAQALIFVPLVIFGAKRWGLEGIVGAGIVAELLVSAWYFPVNFIKRVRFTKEMVVALGSEAFKTFVISFLIIALFRTHADTWISFGAEVMLVSTIYLSALLLLSKALRKEMTYVVNRLRKLREKR